MPTTAAQTRVEFEVSQANRFLFHLPPIINNILFQVLVMGIPASQFSSDLEALEGFESAVAEALGISPSCINITAVDSSNTPKSREVNGRINIQSEFVRVTYTVDVIAQAIGYADGNSAYNALKTNLQQAVDSGKLLTDLKAATSIVLKGVVAVQAFDVSSPVITVERTASPSTSHSLSSTVTSTDSIEGLPMMVFIGIVIGGVAFVILISITAYCVYCKPRSKEKPYNQ